MDFFYQNVNRIRSKCSNIYLNILNCNYDVICFTETNLNASIFDSELFDSNFVVHRRDRETSNSSKREGGGVLIAINNRFRTIRQHSWESHLEDLWITVVSSNINQPVINICVCYLPPYLHISELHYFYNNIQNIVLKGNPNAIYLVMGDFNTPNILWTNNPDNTMTPGFSYDCKVRLLSETLALCNLKQFNSVCNTSNRILDLVLSTDTNITVNLTDELSRADVHHPPLKVTLHSSVIYSHIKYSGLRSWNSKNVTTIR